MLTRSTYQESLTDDPFYVAGTEIHVKEGA